MANKHLYLLRHAKSSWAEDGLDDHARPLAPRGEDAVERLRRHVRRAGITPALVLCSSARRTVMTLEGIARALRKDVETVIDDDLYAASAGRLLSRLRQVPDAVSSVMLIGHNPGLEDLADLLVGAGDEAPRARMAAKFPTAALATLRIGGSWGDLAPGAATLEAFVVPRDLQ